MSEVFVCKFDDKIQCANYACEEDISSLEVTKMECALHARIKLANKILANLPKETIAICPHCKEVTTYGLSANIASVFSELKASLSQEQLSRPTK